MLHHQDSKESGDQGIDHHFQGMHLCDYRRIGRFCLPAIVPRERRGGTTLSFFLRFEKCLLHIKKRTKNVDLFIIKYTIKFKKLDKKYMNVIVFI